MKTTFQHRHGLKPAGWRSNAGVHALVVMAGLLMLLCGNAPAEEVRTSDPNKVMAAFIRNFAHYVIWPTNALPEQPSAWRVGVFGDDSFADTLRKTLAGRVEQGRAFEVVLVKSASEMPFCQIVFIGDKDAGKRREALELLKGRSVLTVGLSPKFLQEGGIIQFQVRDRIEMSIDLDHAGAASLAIPAKMLEVSASVVENGQTRKMR